ncbi:recombinase family protein [Leisingera sp. JC1]|uniref:recombinase family protein n=1 Tax=Leisingera sp. JC1 TaxID=1855282 RepID=UPI003F8CBC6B
MSKADGSQLLDLQRDALIEAGVDAERIYEDKASGRKDHRPGLYACMKALQPGNSLVIWKLDRLRLRSGYGRLSATAAE